ncbi:PH domain-containing protein [Candidatus Parcubacteria bacterium]|nr:PH domain-containing protein [Candidatus Parcubacteria bacterium]
MNKNQRPEPFGTYLGKIATDTIKEKKPARHPITESAFSDRQHVFNPLGRVEDINQEEVKIADIRRHFFGLFIKYLETILAIGLALGLIIFLTPSVFGNGGTAKSAVMLLSLIVITLGALFLVLVTKIYNSNQLIITDINVTQVLQIGLFSRKVSELTMENVEDVTAEQHGIFPTLFNYGTLKVETAGEQNNFIFKYCPNPNAYAKALQDARAAYFKKHSGNRQPGNI